MTKWIVLMLAALTPEMPQVSEVPQTPQTPYVDAANGRSIDDLVALALAQSPAVLAARSREVEASGGLAQAALRPNPMLSVERREEAGAPGHQTSVGIAWPLDLFRRAGRVEVAAEDLTAAGAATLAVEWEIAAMVRAQAGRVLAAIRRAGIAEAVATTAAETLALVDARADSGAAPALERDQAELAWRRRTAESSRLGGEVEAELARLKALIGFRQEASLTLRLDLERATTEIRGAAFDGEARAVPEAGAAGRPDVRRAEAAVTQAVAREALARRLGRLDGALTAGYSRSRAAFPLRGFDAAGDLAPITGATHSFVVGVNLTLPWRNDNAGAAAAASAAVATAERELEARQLAAAADLEAARVRDRRAAVALDALGAEARALAARTLAVVRESHALGRATLTDVLDETRRYLEFESAYTAALTEAFEARVALITASGDVR